MLVRWLGAFRGTGQTLAQSFDWELRALHGREVAAELIRPGETSAIDHALVGLEVAHHAKRRCFDGDVWSEVDGDQLIATRKPVKTHTECFCKPVFTAIVVKEHPSRMGGKAQEAIRNAAKTYKLPIFILDKNGKRRVRF